MRAALTALKLVGSTGLYWVLMSVDWTVAGWVVPMAWLRDYQKADTKVDTKVPETAGTKVELLAV